jgi:riboflavin biosynthesis pyrimidine reductase
MSRTEARELFHRFVTRKTQDAERARLIPLVTLDDRSHSLGLRAIGNAWSRRLYDGGFHVPDVPAGVPAISLVFVESREGNTAVANPEELGGGNTDKHLIYEGLSRVAADAVLAGAATATGRDVFFSVWHPEFVALRAELGLPRHPAQVVISNDGRVDLDALLFNVPDVPVFLIAGARCEERCAAGIAARPWITLVRLTGDLVHAFGSLRLEHRITRISAVGGHSTATALIDAGLVQDLCLTTTARSAGKPHTPFYTGPQPPTLDVIVRKRETSDPPSMTFRHCLIRASG